MRNFILPRWFTRFYSSRSIGLALLGGALAALPLLPANGQEAFQQPDYSKFPPESGPITLEVWSWVGGLDKAAKLFEQAYPDIKVHVNNVGGGPAEYQKLQTTIKAGSGGPDVAQIEYMFLPSFIVSDGLSDLSKSGANDLKASFCTLDLGPGLSRWQSRLRHPARHRPDGIALQQKDFRSVRSHGANNLGRVRPTG
jgi:hypothetical protein